MHRLPITLSPVIVGQYEYQSLHIPVTIGKQAIETKALIDSGAGEIFIHPDFVKKIKYQTRTLRRPITMYNVDNTLNKAGRITQEVVIPMTIKRIRQEILA